MNQSKTLLTILCAALAPSLMAVSDWIAPANALQEPAAEVKKKVPTYVGSMACRKCHGDQHKSWKKTKMAKVFDLLKPGERAEAKTKAGLDPTKDYTRDETCLPCHTTGWGKPGGYKIPPKGDTPEAKKAQKAAAAMEGVQCESCHGPASHAVDYKKKNAEYKWDDVVKAESISGMLYPDEKMCTNCHNTTSPFVDKDYKFEFEKRKEEGTHQHYKMESDHSCPHKHSVTKKKKKKKS